MDLSILATLIEGASHIGRGVYNPTAHKYTSLNGVEFTSVTKVIGGLDEYSNAKALKGVAVSNTYTPIAKAAGVGTGVHSAAEAMVEGGATERTPICWGALKAAMNNGRYVVLAQELELWDEEERVAGRTDLVLWDTEEECIRIGDWKTNRAFRVTSTRNMEGLGLPSSELHHYSVQLGIYRRMLVKALNKLTGDDWSTVVGEGLIVRLPHEGVKPEYYTCVPV